jgi:hypothetical protein
MRAPFGELLGCLCCFAQLPRRRHFYQPRDIPQTLNRAHHNIFLNKENLAKWS